jgi:hypothetical protein
MLFIESCCYYCYYSSYDYDYHYYYLLFFLKFLFIIFLLYASSLLIVHRALTFSIHVQGDDTPGVRSSRPRRAAGSAFSSGDYASAVAAKEHPR